MNAMARTGSTGSDDVAALLARIEAGEDVPRAELAAAVRQLAKAFAAQHPGRSVELRVPPFVAVQAVEGPAHKRGTPPNVVETVAIRWLRVATGRTDFADEVGAGTIRATGPRSDLSGYLPVLL
jgi:hypothetical protein